MRALVTPTRLAALGLAAFALLAFLWVTPSHSYIFLPDRARPLAPKVDVQGERDANDGGGIYYVAVHVKQATLFERLFARFFEGAELVPEDQVLAPGQNEKERHAESLQDMKRSQQIAAAVALRALGRKVTIERRGVLIVAVDPDRPAAGKLEPGDIVIAADGHRTVTPPQLANAIRAHPPGETVRLRIRRDGRTRETAVETVAGPSPDRHTIIGVAIDQAARIRLPVPIRINLGEVGGPSAGLAFALDILEELGRDVDHGRRIAATGALELDGSVEPVGGIEQKTIGARRAGSDLFLVPAGENAVEAKRYADGLRIVPVKTFRQALRVLATSAQNTR